MISSSFSGLSKFSLFLKRFLVADRLRENLLLRLFASPSLPRLSIVAVLFKNEAAKELVETVKNVYWFTLTVNLTQNAILNITKPD
jgi:hypothetical protein